MLTKDSLGPFKAALSEALRTTDQHDIALRERFVEAADVAWNGAQASDPPKLQFRIDAENIHAGAGELFDR